MGMNWQSCMQRSRIIIKRQRRSELDKIKTDVGAIQTQQVDLIEVVGGMQSAVQDLSQQLQIMSEVLKDA